MSLQTLEQKIRKHNPELQGDISLENVLHAVQISEILKGKKLYPNHTLQSLFVNQYGNLHIAGYTTDEKKRVVLDVPEEAYWDMTLPLSQQSPEVIEFINKLVD